MGGVRAARARARREAVVGVVGYGYDGGDGVRAARARREGVVTVEVQAWCAASVVWRVMREKTKERKKRRRREEEEKKKRREEEKQR